MAAWHLTVTLISYGSTPISLCLETRTSRISPSFLWDQGIALREALGLIGERTAILLAPSAAAARVLEQETGGRTRTLQWLGMPSPKSWDYRRLPRVDERPAHLEIFEHEAAIVRRIFDDYVRKNILIRQIAKGLNRDGIRSPTGRPIWSVSTISRLLRDEAYIGWIYYNRTETVP